MLNAKLAGVGFLVQLHGWEFIGYQVNTTFQSIGHCGEERRDCEMTPDLIFFKQKYIMRNG